MRTDSIDFAVIKNDDFIGVLNGAYTLSNNNLCNVGMILSESVTDFCIRCGINGTCGVIENKDF